VSLLDLILNIAGLLLCVSWRYVPFDPIHRAKPTTLTGTLRRAEPTRVRRWHFLAALFALLLLRAVFYWWIGGALDWAPGIKLGAIAVSFRSDVFARILLFSFGSFADTLIVFYVSLIALWLAGPHIAEADPCQRFIRIQLGPAHKWPKPVLALLPLAVTGSIWMAVGPLLGKWQIVPRPGSWIHLLEQSTVLGLSVYPVGKHVVGVVLGLHLLNTYVYLGRHPAWQFINAAGKRLLTPLKPVPLRFGKMDFAPLLGIALVYGLARLAESGLSWLFVRLPL
jgi:hypothetical protein